eukprot:SAG11_NODE_681_length_7772_cov_26.403362_6_plen_93_part_00
MKLNSILSFSRRAGFEQDMRYASISHLHRVMEVVAVRHEPQRPQQCAVNTKRKEPVCEHGGGCRLCSPPNCNGWIRSAELDSKPDAHKQKEN